MSHPPHAPALHFTPPAPPQGNYSEDPIAGKFMSLSLSHMMYEREAAAELKEEQRE